METSGREALDEAQRSWRQAEDALTRAGAGRRIELGRRAVALRDAYSRLYTEAMIDLLRQLRAADGRRARSTPSTPAFHAATRETEEVAADIWQQAHEGDRDSPPSGGGID